MPSPSIYLDQCVDQHLIPRLRQRGYTVTSAYEHHLVHVSDTAQLLFATQHGWAMLTHNKLHFQREHRQFLQQGRAHGGIITVPQGSLTRLELRVAMLLDWISQRGTWQSQFFRWHDVQVWLDQGNRLPGYSEADVQTVLGR